MSDFYWSKFLQKGDELFEYLNHHFHEMFHEDGSIKNLYMYGMSYSMVGYYNEVFEEYGQRIHDAILPWIHEEYQSGRLLNKEDWKPFRDQEVPTTCYYGYRKLFMYDKYYIQLAIIGEKDDAWFEIELYGWKKDGKDYLASDHDTMKMPEDMRMPEEHWSWT